jgi:hypothetical protein
MTSSEFIEVFPRSAIFKSILLSNSASDIGKI